MKTYVPGREKVVPFFLFQNISSYSGSRRGSNDSTGSDVSRDSNDPKDQARKFKVSVHVVLSN